MTVSQVTVQTLKEYLRIDTNEENALLEAILAAGRQYIRSQTGLIDDECETKEDLSVALMVLCSEMYDNRSYTTNANRTANTNKVVESILAQYSGNLL